MTHAARYAQGFADGVFWAENDIRARSRNADRFSAEGDRAYLIGYMRGYRDTWARWDAGTLTWEMLDQAPVNR